MEEENGKETSSQDAGAQQKHRKIFEERLPEEKLAPSTAWRLAAHLSPRLVKVTPFMKGLAVGLVAGVALALFFFFRAGHLSTLNAGLKAKYDRQAEANAMAAAGFDKDRAAWAKDRAGYELAAKTATARADALTGEAQKAKAAVLVITGAAEKLRAEVQPAIDANPALKKYVDFILAGSAKKDELIAGLEARDEERQKTIGAQLLEIASWKNDSASWRRQYQNEKSLNMIAESRISALTLSLRIEKLKWGLKGLALGAGGVVAYTIIHALIKKGRRSPKPSGSLLAHLFI
jgi:hypothetical protein